MSNSETLLCVLIAVTCVGFVCVMLLLWLILELLNKGRS